MAAVAFGGILNFASSVELTEKIGKTTQRAKAGVAPRAKSWLCVNITHAVNMWHIPHGSVRSTASLFAMRLAAVGAAKYQLMMESWSN